MSDPARRPPRFDALADLPDVPADTLGLEAEEMRRLGYRVVDMVVDRAMRRGQEPAILTGAPEDLRAALGGPLPEAPIDPEASLDLMAEVALAHQQHGDHPRYFARVPGPAAFAAILGEWMGTGFNTICASWGGASGPAMVELVVIDWLAEMLGMPAETEGVLLSGGSMGNLTGFAAARAALGPGVAYLTDQTHASLPRNLRTLGFAQEEIAKLPAEADWRMSADTLRAAIARDRAAGRRPMMVVATAGSTNTGAVDPLPEIAEICAAEGLWLHVDGAYGAPAAITPEGRAALAGMERADSLALDPHKWLFQPYDLGVCLVTRPGALEAAFAISPEYLRDVRQAGDAVNFGNRSLELSRRSRALKLWMSLRTYGADRFRAAVRRGMELAELAERVLRERPGTWEVVTPAQLGIVCFALRGADAGKHEAAARAVSESGYACVTTTSLGGRSVLRLCTINPLTTEDDIRGTLERLAAV
ncbi:pyridoxal-dependent decarboxylase [Rhodosalinus halophilus]|uniref:Pyridoxal-dependent decarboxylase n=1 Tax=Rhodosalinus halophilus TaxID=2259333 RepID=A0A365U644_9RHOB|nr:aminotransferase class I/II-fold pyridoxal phosphate-dependent enzyme [Rhodosalinus halophilus]RBI83695.1 pyridoxal-dependent decarboxylase [Rhodosalinus halophilus]